MGLGIMFIIGAILILGVTVAIKNHIHTSDVVFFSVISLIFSMSAIILFIS